MPITIGSGLSFCGHALRNDELDLIRRITREFANLTVTELAATLCELLEWRRPNGGLESRDVTCFYWNCSGEDGCLGCRHSSRGAGASRG